MPKDRTLFTISEPRTVPADLWTAFTEKLRREGRTTKAAIRAMIALYVDGRITLPMETDDDATPKDA